MSDLRRPSDEPWVGAGHASLGDNLNRLAMGASAGYRDEEGKDLYLLLEAQASEPSPDADELDLFAQEGAGGVLRLYYKRNDGTIVMLA